MRKRLLDIALPVVSIVVFLVLWENAITWFGIQSYLLPSPVDVGKTLWIGYAGGRFWPHLGVTFYEMAAGYAIGCGAAFLVGSLAAESWLFERLVYPYVIGLQSLPKVAIAPLIIVWFGFGAASKIVLVALICFFPIFVNCVAGLRSTNSDLVDLYRVFGASRLSIFFNVKLPSAAASIFAGLQISVVLALIGAVVGEFIAARQGLGYLIQSSTVNFDVATMFAAILSLSIIGVIATTVIRMIERRVVFWIGRKQNVTVVEAA